MYLLIVGSDYCVMHFAHALYMRWQNLVFFPCLYTEPFELIIEIVFHCCTTPPCHKTSLLRSPFWGSRFQRLNDAFVLLISIFLYPQNNSLLETSYVITPWCNINIAITRLFAILLRFRTVSSRFLLNSWHSNDPERKAHLFLLVSKPHLLSVHIDWCCFERLPTSSTHQIPPTVACAQSLA